MTTPRTILAAFFPAQTPDVTKIHDTCSSLQELVAVTSDAGKDVRVVTISNPSSQELQAKIQEVSPSVLFIAGPSNYDVNRALGSVQDVQLTDGANLNDFLPTVCSSIDTVYVDAPTQGGLGAKLRAAGVQHALLWPEGSVIPAVVASQFSHTFFSCLLYLKATVHEAYALASHVVQAHCTTKNPADDKYVPPALPHLLSTVKAGLPDNTSIVPPKIPGADPGVTLVSSVPGWSDIRLLAPRAELRLLLTGSPTLIDGHKLSFLGEALRALLVLEMRNLTLVSTTACPKTPANLPLGCTAIRCEVRTTSGAQVVAVLGGQPSVLADKALVEHALRMTLVADSLSLQFRLPPPHMSAPVSRRSAVIAGGTPVVDALVLTSVWAVNVLRSLSLMPVYKPLVSLGVAAVGGTATVAVSALDAQRLKIIVTGEGPTVHPLMQILPPGATAPQSVVAGPQGGADGMLVET